MIESLLHGAGILGGSKRGDSDRCKSDDAETVNLC